MCVFVCSFSISHCRFLASQGCIEALCDILTCPDPKVVTICLDGLDNFLNAGEAGWERRLYSGGVNEYADRIVACKGWDKIQELTSHNNNAIREKAVRILESYRI